MGWVDGGLQGRLAFRPACLSAAMWVRKNPAGSGDVNVSHTWLMCGCVTGAAGKPGLWGAEPRGVLPRARGPEPARGDYISAGGLEVSASVVSKRVHEL